MTAHNLSSLRDNYVTEQFCSVCGKDGLRLLELCEPLEAVCNDCGRSYWQNSCPHCQLIREKFLTTTRNFPKSDALNNLFNSKTKGTKL